MGGVYGTMIPAFAEQLRSVLYYDMSPNIDSGFGTKTNSSTIKVIFQNTKPKAVSDANGNLVYTSGLEIWSELELIPGRFINDGIDVYRILQQNKWSYEGNLYAYGLEKVVGDNGDITNSPSYNFGGSSFS